MFINKNKFNNIQFHTNVMYMVYLREKKKLHENYKYNDSKENVLPHKQLALTTHKDVYRQKLSDKQKCIQKG